MIDLPQLQLLAQLLDNMEIIVDKMEKSYNENDGEIFKKTKVELLSMQNKISRIV